MENIENVQDIFDLSIDTFINSDESTKDSVIYKPKAKDGKDGVYTSLIRFLPFYKNVAKSRIMKWTHWLTDVEGNGSYYDCPTTKGEKCPICSKFFELRKSDSIKDQERAKEFRRSQSFFHLVQIIDDKQNPDLNGKILVFKYAKTIDEKYQAELKPEYGQPVVPSDLLNGKPFLLKITQKGNWNNYDLCTFLSSEPIKIDGKPIQRTKEDMARVAEYLKANSPDIEKYDFAPWTDADRDKINSIINGESSFSMSRRLEQGIESELSNEALDLTDSTLSSFVEEDIKQVKKQSVTQTKSSEVKNNKPNIKITNTEETVNEFDDDDESFDDFEENFDDEFFNGI